LLMNWKMNNTNPVIVICRLIYPVVVYLLESRKFIRRSLNIDY